MGGIRQQFSLPENIQLSLFSVDFLRKINVRAVRFGGWGGVPSFGPERGGNKKQEQSGKEGSEPWFSSQLVPRGGLGLGEGPEP